MRVSFNWIKEYVNFELSPEETAKYLTDCGLEVEGIEQFETVKGGLQGLVIGEVLTCEPHPDSDHLHITTVNVGTDIPLNVVCGAANVARGQKVVVATIGTVLYSENDSFTIKKSKIRGAVSEGMICAEDEIGIGTSHDGIMVLDESAVPGTPASQYFKIESDYILEIGLTPNRSDAISHFGVARDLYAALVTNNVPCSSLIFPQSHDFIPITKADAKVIQIDIENKEACPRYTGLTFENVTVKESPEWLKNRLRSIGVRPINNVVDITQYVMFEIGQPLHAFDANFIEGDKVIIKNLPDETPFITLDGNEIKLSKDDLMICNEKAGMCIAGVYGGLHSGVTEKTHSIFLESAYFNPVSVRKTSKRHHLKTDAAFRFERGTDPNITVHAIRRAANLIQELTGAVITSEIIDVYPDKIEPRKIKLSVEELSRFIGKELSKNEITSILMLLGMEVTNVNDDQLLVTVPLNRVDVTRQVDLIEEVLRIYGYNNIEIPDKLSYQLSNTESSPDVKWKRLISTYLVNNGFFEMINNPLTKMSYGEEFNVTYQTECVQLLNPLSRELNSMRQTLLFSGLETIARNINNKNQNLRLFEFGNIYIKNQYPDTEDVMECYYEFPRLTMFVTGKTGEEQWNQSARELDLFNLKNVVEQLLVKLNLPVQEMTCTQSGDDMLIQYLSYLHGIIDLIKVGEVHPKILKAFDIKKPVYYAEFIMEEIYPLCFNQPVLYSEIPLYPAVKRDLALVIDKEITYLQLETIAKKYGSKLLKSVSLFDVYEGDKIAEGKKSYALNFVLQHKEKTLTEEEINKTMNKLIAAFENELGAQLRS